MTPRPEDHLWWLASRASGLIALGLMTASVVIGLLMAAKLSSRPGLKVAMVKLHEQLAVISLGAIGLHAVTLLGDPWLRPSLAGIFVPGAIDYRPLFVASGIVGAYLAAALGLTFYARKRLGSKRWRNAHRFIIVAWGLAVVHAVGAGTDIGLAAVRWPLAIGVAGVAVLLGLRILGSASSAQPGNAQAKPAESPGA